MKRGATELAVVVPVYNEEAVVATVLEKWSDALNALGIEFRIDVYNDGSKDNTLKVLKDAAARNDRIVVHDKTNTGHGPTVLAAYIENSDVPWIFQIDSDDEMEPEYFASLWKEREAYDFLIGQRMRGYAPPVRRVVSMVSRVVARLLYGGGVHDVNVPYRLMRSEKFKEYFPLVPSDTFAPNVVISGVACLKGFRVFETPILHKHRTTGEVSIQKWKLLKSAARSFAQTVAFRFKL